MSIWEQPSPESSPSSPASANPDGSGASGPGGPMPASVPRPDHAEAVRPAPALDPDGAAVADALPTMADLDVLGRELDAVDATLVALDARTLDVPSSEGPAVTPSDDANIAPSDDTDDPASDGTDEPEGF